ncbi:hypothetical protein ACU60G_19055 [Klebsiella aerogenes]
MIEQSELYDALKGMTGVSSITEHKFKANSESDYYAFGSFSFTSDENEAPYSIVYSIFRKPLSVAIGFSINFLYEKFERKLLHPEVVELVDKYNRYSIGIKAHTLEQERDDELKVSLNTEFYLAGSTNLLEEQINNIYVTLRFLENAPLVFSDYLKDNGINHDYLSSEIKS